MKKDKITVSLNKEILDWIDEKIKDHTFASRSHGIEYLIYRAIKQGN